MSNKYIAVATGCFASPGSPLACQVFVNRGDGLYITATGFDNSPVEVHKAIKMAELLNRSQGKTQVFTSALPYASPTRYAALDKNGIKNQEK